MVSVEPAASFWLGFCSGGLGDRRSVARLRDHWQSAGHAHGSERGGGLAATWHHSKAGRSAVVYDCNFCIMWLREFQFGGNSDWWNRGAGAGSTRQSCQTGHTRDVGGHHGEPDVGFVRRNSHVTSTSIGSDEYEWAEAAAQFIFGRTKLRPKIALVLGSGLGPFADEFANASKIPYADIPHFPQSTAIGHAGQLVVGDVNGIAVAGMQGRVHLYEGYSVKEVSFPIRVFARMGVKAVILTNAAGGIKFTQGRLVVISDHINLQGVNPLTGFNDERFGPRFPDMSTAYDKRFREMTVGQGNRLGIGIDEGVYAALAGPSYETPAEIRYLRTIGADLGA